jgi:hypothetical protein
MDARKKRIGENESLFREVNERLIDLNSTLGVNTDRLEFLCECGNRECAEKIPMTQQEYEHLRSDAATFAVVPGHEIPDVEHVVDRKSVYIVVRKKPGGPAELAARHDPRS